MTEFTRGQLIPTSSGYVSTGVIFLESVISFFSTIRANLEHTIVSGYGSSLMVVGPPGSGKTWVSGRLMCGRMLVCLMFPVVLITAGERGFERSEL